MPNSSILSFLQHIWQHILGFIYHRISDFNRTMKPLLDALGIRDPWTFLYSRRGTFYSHSSFFLKGFFCVLVLLYFLVPLLIGCLILDKAINFVRRKTGFDDSYNYSLYYKSSLPLNQRSESTISTYLYRSWPAHGFRGDALKRLVSIIAKFLVAVVVVSYASIALFMIVLSLLDALHINNYTIYPGMLDILKGLLIPIIIIGSLFLFAYLLAFLLCFVAAGLSKLKSFSREKLLDLTGITIRRSCRLRVVARSNYDQ